MVLLPLSYRKEYEDFIKSSPDDFQKNQKIRLLSNRAKLEERSRILQACAVAIFAAYGALLASTWIFNLPPGFEILKLSANLTIALGLGFVFYRWRQPEYFEAKLF